MFVEEADAKRLLAAGGIHTPVGTVAETVAEAVLASGGPVMVKAQVPAGKRGKAGGIVAADSAEEVEAAARRLLGSELGDHMVDRVLVEPRVEIAHELYVAVVVDATSAGPLLMVSAHGGVDIEDVHESSPESVAKMPIDISIGLTPSDAEGAVAILGNLLDGEQKRALVDVLLRLYERFRFLDAQLVEINPLAVTTDGSLVALDAKLIVDDNALLRQLDLPAQRAVGTALELEAAEQGFLFVELDGDVGVLANGAGLTMATMDAVTAHGGAPANFLEVGGMAYKRATPALALVLKNPKVKSLLVNLCGAYARTDVIAEGLIEGWKTLAPDLEVSFCIHGTGEERAQELVRTELGREPHESMDDAIREAIANAAKRVEATS